MSRRRPLIVIPARLDSSRFPNKPLHQINEKTMLDHVYDRALSFELGEVLVATPDEKIKNHMEKQNKKCILTKHDHESGTDRVLEAAQKTNIQFDENYIINLQGDLPDIKFEHVQTILNLLEDCDDEIATLISKITKEEAKDPNKVKVAVKDFFDSKTGYAVFMSRNPIYTRLNHEFEHIGVFGFSMQTLEKFMRLPCGTIENVEKIELLRCIESKMIEVSLGFIKNPPTPIDTPEDLNELGNI